ncbi:MAG: TetR/AcrR family transcriptional regulator [Chloroflexota bacterium]
MKNDNYHHGNLREALIDIALDILEEEGSAGIKMRAVGKRAGVSASAAYRHFSDKSALLAAVAKRGFDDLTIALNQVRTKTHLSVDEQLQEMGVIYVVFAVEHASQYRLMYGSEAIRTEDYPDLAASAHNMSREYALLVKQCQASGVMKGETTTEILHVMWACTHGAAMLVIDGFISPPDIYQYARNIVNYVDAGIREDD